MTIRPGFGCIAIFKAKNAYTFHHIALALLAAAAFILPHSAMAAKGTGDKAIEDMLSGKTVKAIDCRADDQRHEEADGKLVNTAWDLLKKRDIAGLRALLPELEAAGNRAPDQPVMVEKCGSKFRVYGDGLAAGLMAASTAAKEEKDTEIVLMGDLPYGDLHFVIGWIYFEDKDFARADEWFVRGLKNNPHDAMMASEHAEILSRTGRCAEVLPFVDAFLADNDDLSDDLHALMLRRRGYCQGDLGRHDEAIATYKKALKLAPGSKVAEAELKWNQDQKKAKKAKAS